METSRESLVTRLREFGQFADCSEHELEELAHHCEEVHVPEGWAFILEGTPGDTCYLVLAGTVRVSRDGFELATVGPGDLVGEIAIIEQRSRTATCSAVTPLDLLQMEAAEFNGWLQQRPKLRDRLLSRAAGRRPTGG
jgi:CRP/FNR family cyclic AMP-dependent transcriptional regulator